MNSPKSIFIISFSLICLLFSSGCDSSKSEMIIEPGIHEPLNTVSRTTAEMIANSIMSDDAIIPTRSEGYKVKDYFSIPAEDGSDLIHVFNYEGGGFVLIAGDNRLEPVLAYSERSSFSNGSSKPLGLQIWLGRLNVNLKDLKNNRREQESGIKYLWENYTSGNETFTRSLTPEEGIDPESDTLVGPLILDSWYEGEPFNEGLGLQYHYMTYYSYINNTEQGQWEYHVPVIGGLPMSIARIMHFWNYPTSYPWNSMSNSSADTYNVSLIQNVYNDVLTYSIANGYSVNYQGLVNADGNYVQRYYTSFSPSFPTNIYLINAIGFSSAISVNYSLSDRYIIRREIFDNLRPVILTGSCNSESLLPTHTWICDGYHYKFEHWYDENMNPIGVVTNKMHHRWGMGGYDGWYSSSDMDIYGDGDTYDVNMKLVYKIYP